MSLDRARTQAKLALREAHAEHPEAKLVHITDPRHGASFVLAIGPDSPWHELLPAYQYTTIIERP